VWCTNVPYVWRLRCAHALAIISAREPGMIAFRCQKVATVQGGRKPSSHVRDQGAIIAGLSKRRPWMVTCVTLGL
jgi:hypothetical protein